MCKAFHGDPALKAALLARIDTYVGKDGPEDGVGALVALTGSADPSVYSETYGYPLPLSGLVDPLTGILLPGSNEMAFLREWNAVVEPGADLSDVPTRLMLFMLSTPQLRGIDDMLAARLIALHSLDLTESSASRADWATMRRTILDGNGGGADARRALAFQMWEACSWPAGRGRSTLASAYPVWQRLSMLDVDPDWSAQDDARKETILGGLWIAHKAAREADELVPYHEMLMAQDADLATRYLAHIARTNAIWIARSREMQAQCIRLLKQANEQPR